MQKPNSFTFVLPAIIALLGGCIVFDPNNNPPTLSGPSSGGAGGMDGLGGSGGAAGGGAGGAGVGGGAACVGDKGSLNVDACQKLQTAQDPNLVCGPDKLAPWANDMCLLGFQNYRAGAADYLQSCLMDIQGDAVNACDDAQVQTCVDAMYKVACPSDTASFACESIAKDLCINMEVFDTQGCVFDMTPFNGIAVQDLLDGITKSSLTDCNAAYKESYNNLFVLKP